jgi:chlorophyll synthase
MEAGQGSTSGFGGSLPFQAQLAALARLEQRRLEAVAMKLRLIMKITMPNRAAIACITFWVGMAMSGTFHLPAAFFGAMAMLTTYMSQAVYNCIRDVEGDRVNAPWQPLANGALSERFAWELMTLLIVLGFIFAWLASPWLVVVNAIFVLLGVFYSAYAKAKHLLSYATLVTTHMAIPVAAGYLLFGHLDARIAIVVAFIYLTEVLAMSIKDYKDVHGDRKMGLQTLPIVLGPRNAAKVTFAGFCMPLFLAWIPWAVLRLPLEFLALSLVAGGLRFALGWQLVRNPSPQQGGRILNKFRYLRILQIAAWCLT